MSEILSRRLTIEHLKNISLDEIIAGTTSSCRLCKGNHTLQKCPAFRRLKPYQRLGLAQSHFLKNCRSRERCMEWNHTKDSQPPRNNNNKRTKATKGNNKGATRSQAHECSCRYRSHKKDNTMVATSKTTGATIVINVKFDSSDVEDIDAIDGRIPRVPKAIPETDDEGEYDGRPNFIGRRMGVDDGLLSDIENGINRNHHPSRPPSRRASDSFLGHSGIGFVDINGVSTPIPDINAYQHKKTLAQGMMDLALLSANANQLRYVLESYDRHPYYYPSLVLISLSIICQIVVGVGLILKSKYNVKNEKDICRANTINNYTLIGIFIVTVVNVFISAFGVADLASEKDT